MTTSPHNQKSSSPTPLIQTRISFVNLPSVSPSGVANRSLPHNQHAGYKRSSTMTTGAGVVTPTTANIARGTSSATLDNGSAAIRKKAKL